MLGFLAAVVNEAQTGMGPIGQVRQAASPVALPGAAAPHQPALFSGVWYVDGISPGCVTLNKQRMPCSTLCWHPYLICKPAYAL